MSPLDCRASLCPHTQTNSARQQPQAALPVSGASQTCHRRRADEQRVSMPHQHPDNLQTTPRRQLALDTHKTLEPICSELQHYQQWRSSTMAWVIRRRESIMLDNYHHSWKAGVEPEQLMVLTVQQTHIPVPVCVV